MNVLRCSSVARDEGLDPLGTAGDQRGFLLVDWPLPWPGDLGDVAELLPLVAGLAGTGIRLQGVVPAEGEERRVVLHHRPPGDGFVRYARVERRAAPDDVVAVALELLATVGGADGPGPAETPAPHGDLLVCTHGRRDVCCGRQGTALALAAEPAVPDAGYRLSRTSHTGGHRFAPTAIVLPEGTMWAFLDAELAVRILRRQGPVEAALGHYRGSTAIGSPALQAVERAAFAEVGWDWLGWRRWGEDDGGGRVRLVGEAPDGSRVAWEATVSDRSRPVPVCGRPLTEAVKQQNEPVLVSIGRAAPPAVTA